MRASLTLRTIAVAAIGMLFLAMLLVGCSGSNSTSSTASSEQDQMRNTASMAQSESLPVGDAAMNAIDTGTNGGVDNADDSTAQLSSGVVVGTSLGLHFLVTHGLWDRSLRVPLWKYLLNHSGDATPVTITVTITGTLADGTTINITRTGTTQASDQGVYSIADTGTITTKGGTVYYLQSTRNIDHQAGVSITQQISRQLNLGSATGQEIYNENLTRIIDLTSSAPRPRTLDGTIIMHNLTNPSISRTVTFTALHFYWDGNYRYFLSGTLAISHSTTGYTATLTTPTTPDGSISGPILDAQDNQVGTMTINQGQTTITWNPTTTP